MTFDHAPARYFAPQWAFPDGCDVLRVVGDGEAAKTSRMYRDGRIMANPTLTFRTVESLLRNGEFTEITADEAQRRLGTQPERH